MKHPYQCVQYFLDDSSNDRTGRFIAASGPRIISFSMETGEIVSIWPESSPSDEVTVEEINEEPEESPKKKRKISESSEPLSNVIILKLTHDGRHAVAVTGEDKCVRVFEFDETNRIKQLSSRCMPKRPCAIKITPDNKTILCGDKFGDVYALPLLPTPEQLQPPTPAETAEKDEPKSFTPSATTLTVHSGRNRRALEMQQKTAAPAKAKQPLQFAHELLLGHVSMLTDIAFITHKEALDGEAKPRSYILTSDRDEHIRISRGPPQAHIIEGFCLGHKEFVNCLCAIDENTLVSGGGDDYLLVWDLGKREVRERIELRDAANKVLKMSAPYSDEPIPDQKIAVSGLWAISSDRKSIVLLITVEGVPALFSYAIPRSTDGSYILNLSEAGKEAEPLNIIPLRGNVLDIGVSNSQIIVSVDNIHGPGSRESIGSQKDEVDRLYAFTLGNTPKIGSWKHVEDVTVSLRPANDAVEFEVKTGTSIKDLLYGVENLRKRGGAEEE